ncbi:uncharacterized protein B0H18DRAFT_984213 [Fomitopsis serialis]|uniref:uncharacterized protein n=1 Tax=Fomitopsis serialis TaxID=139415 RepID=UPI002007FB80|nr:uncharacterized protein B0H18DRAFT_984213 [Neoantrodia serialis]KAH9933524.1 hypothetical protein B0H18DRAFT_984213 [Neoantrodia serialis]
MDAPSTSAAALKLEIARLSGVINRHKTGEHHPQSRPTVRPTAHPRSNVYVNPSYKPASKTARPQNAPPPRSQAAERPSNAQKHDVVIGGVAFEASGRSLVRKDLAKPTTSAPGRPISAKAAFIRDKNGTMINANRTYKPKTSRRMHSSGRNMTLNNMRRPYQSVPFVRTLLPVQTYWLPRNRRVSNKRKSLNKPCPRFTTTGACNRGLTCMYQHDPSKIAICWPFLQGNCPNTAETCPLSHDPTPERTPLCVHFANNGRCTRPNCPFPHVRVGQRGGVCRDFAVLGYCEKGLDCDKQHVRECPDFAEKGACTTKGCKLPHVIRANRARKIDTNSTDASAGQSSATASASSVEPDAGSDTSSPHPVTAEDAQLGDEFISLTFHESDSEDDEDEEESEGDEEDDDEEGDEQSEPRSEPSPSVEGV